MIENISVVINKISPDDDLSVYDPAKELKQNFRTLKEAQIFVQQNCSANDCYKIIKHSNTENTPCEILAERELLDKTLL